MTLSSNFELHLRPLVPSQFQQLICLNELIVLNTLHILIVEEDPPFSRALVIVEEDPPITIPTGFTSRTSLCRPTTYKPSSYCHFCDRSGHLTKEFRQLSCFLRDNDRQQAATSVTFGLLFPFKP